MKSFLALPLALGAAGIVAATAGAATPAPTLSGSVGPGFTISLNQGGKKVKTLKAGAYKLVVTDKATIHNFELEGPGVKKIETDVSEKGTKTFALKLKKGTYTFYCKPHESSMRGTFTVK
jgi:plastocyanin